MNGNVMGWWQVWPFPALHVPDYEILYYIRAILLTSEFMIVSVSLPGLTQTEGKAVLGFQKCPVLCQQFQKHFTQLMELTWPLSICMTG